MNTWRSLPSGGPLTPRVAALRYKTLPDDERRLVRLMTMAEVVARWAVHMDTARRWKKQARQEFGKETR